MQGKTHAAWGMASGIICGVVAGAQSWPEVAACAAIGGLSGLAPDWLQVNIPGVKQVQGMLGHRGFSHWIWTPLISTYVLHNLAIAPSSLAAAFLAAWVSHILLDSLSNGVPAFWPFGRLAVAKIKTGSRWDNLIGGAGIVIAAMAILRFTL